MNALQKETLQSGRLYAVGDIHGCVSELEIILSFLVHGENLQPADKVVFIGDYIDRGPGCRETLDLLIDFKRDFPGTVFLKGNHEEMMLSFLDAKNTENPVWLVNGADTTLSAYGVSIVGDVQETRRNFESSLPARHLEFLRNLELISFESTYVFAHAGVHPLRDIHFQLESDLLWIRDEFISNVHHFGLTVIFGHTPFEDVLFHLPYKIGIDTGCVYGNRLTLIDLTGKKVHQVKRDSSEVSSSSFPC